MIKEDIDRITQEVVKEKGAGVYWIDFKSGLVRVYVEKPEGITAKDCEGITKELSRRLKAITGYPLTLEVSSPGIERKLHTPEDFKRFVNNRANIITQNQSITGKIEEVTPLGIKIEHSGFIPFEEIKRASLKRTDKELFRRRDG